LDDLTLAYSALGHLPELLMLILRPKGKVRVGAKYAIQSKLGLSRLEVAWRTIELWTLSAEQFLAEADVGVMPWVPLMQLAGPPEAVLERCAQRIERQAKPKDRTDLLVVAQVMAGLRYPHLDLLALFGGQQTMIESPLLQRVRAEVQHGAVLDLLKDRFGAVPRDVTKPLREIIDEKKLRRLVRLAAKCADLDAFREALRS
jgi:predicted transposase YdaD